MAKTASAIAVSALFLATCSVGVLFTACGGGDTEAATAGTATKSPSGSGDDDPISATPHSAADDDAPGAPGEDAAVATTDSGPASACAICTGYAAMTSVATLAYSDMEELSGLAASRNHKNVFYTHNDSGDTARFFAISAAGVRLGEFRLAGVTAIDWEDVSVGPCCAPGAGACGDKSCIFIADIGDNSENRTDLAVYRVEEPDSPSTATPKDLAFDKLSVKYPDGKHNSEAFAIHPKTGDGYVIAKANKLPIQVYKLPAGSSTAGEITLTAVGPLNVPESALVKLVTGADIHPCQDRILVRTYTAVYDFAAPPGQAFEKAFAAVPVSLPTPAEIQGEAIAWGADGRGYFSIGEAKGPKLSRSVCQ